MACSYRIAFTTGALPLVTSALTRHGVPPTGQRADAAAAIREHACRLIQALVWDGDHHDVERPAVTEAVPAMLRCVSVFTCCAALDCIVKLASLASGRRALQAAGAFEIILQPTVVKLGLARLDVVEHSRLLAELVGAPEWGRGAQRLADVSREHADSEQVSQVCLHAIRRVVLWTGAIQRPALQGAWDAGVWRAVSCAAASPVLTRAHCEAVASTIIAFASRGVTIRVPASASGRRPPTSMGFRTLRRVQQVLSHARGAADPAACHLARIWTA